MSDYEHGYDTPDAYDQGEYLDPTAIAQEAAENVAHAVAPILQQQQAQIEQLTAIGQMQAQKYALERNEEEQRNALEAQRIARERVGPDWWDANKSQLADYLDANEELLPESRFGSPEAIAEGLVTGARMYREDAQKEAARANDDLARRHVEQMRESIAGSRYWEDPEFKKAQG